MTYKGAEISAGEVMSPAGRVSGFIIELDGRRTIAADRDIARRFVDMIRGEYAKTAEWTDRKGGKHEPS